MFLKLMDKLFAMVTAAIIVGYKFSIRKLGY